MMINDVFKKQIQSSTDEKLLEILKEKTIEYSESAIDIAKEEAERRGGLQVIQQKIHAQYENEKNQKGRAEDAQPTLYQRKLLCFLSSLMPVKESFENYPSIYVVCKALKIFAMFMAMTGTTTLIALIVILLIGNLGFGMVLVITFFKQVTAFIALWVVSELLQILVDIERNTRIKKDQRS